MTKRPLPLWILGVVPATIAGHALTYAITGRSMAETTHLWVAPALEGSVALLLGCALWLFGGALLRTGFVIGRLCEQETMHVWPRMAAVQTLLFVALERFEGSGVSLFGCAVQLLVALLVAHLLHRFVAMLGACERATQRAARYLERLDASPLAFVGRDLYRTTIALEPLAVRRRFGRAPPNP